MILARRPVTLAFCNPGDLIGWAGLVRRSPCEWVTASSTLKLIGFPSDVFYELESECDTFSKWLDRNDSPSELISTLTPALRRRPRAEPPEREVLRRLLPGMSVVPAQDIRELPEDGAVWLWNSQPSHFSVEIGKNVELDLLTSIPRGEPLRLLRIESDLWKQELEPDLQSPDSIEVSSTQDIWSQDRYSDLSVPAPEGQRHSVEIGVETDLDVNKFRGRNIPVVTGIGPHEQAMACLEMLALFYNTPFRRDVLYRMVGQSLGKRTVSLELLGNIAVSMGFVGSIANIPEAQLTRLPFPCFVITHNQPAMLHDISNGVVKLVLPEFGKVEISTEDLVQDKGGARVLTLSPGRDTQNESSDFHGFCHRFGVTDVVFRGISCFTCTSTFKSRSASCLPADF